MKKVMLAIILLILCGCASLKYTDAKGGIFEYYRIGAQSIEGLTMQIDENGILNIRLDKNKSDAGDLGKAVADLAEVAAKISK